MATVKFKGNIVNIGNGELKVGDEAPLVVVTKNDLSDFQIGKKAQVLVAVPSLDTPVCAMEAKKFSKEVSSIKGVEIVTISMDLPFAMSRFCAAEGVENLIMASDFRNKGFGKAYGILMSDGLLAGLLARSVFVIDNSGKLVYKEVCEEVTSEPDYQKALEAIKSIA